MFVFGSCSLLFAITWFTLYSGIDGCNTRRLFYESLSSLFRCFNSTRKCLFFFFFFVYVQLWILGRATHKSWSLHFSVAAMLAPPSYLVLPCQLSIEWMWRCGDAVSYFQPAAVSGSSVVAELCVYECVALPLVNCVLMTEEKDAYILWS